MRAVLAAGGVAWVCLVLSTPLLPTAAAAFVYVFGSVICHQLSDRSFHLGASQLPVCARCVGVYAGFAAAACALTLQRVGARLNGGRIGGGAKSLRRLFLWCAAPTTVTVALEWAGVWQPSNTTRAAAGALLGMGVAAVLAAAWTVRQRPTRRAGTRSALAAH